MDLRVAAVALADQLRAGVDADVTVVAYPAEDTIPVPRVSVIPDRNVVDYVETFSSGGLSTVRLLVKVETGGDSNESAMVRVSEFLSVGSGFASSVSDAVMRDRTLGGRVDDAIVLDAEMPDPEGEPGVAYVGVQVRMSKSGAQV